MDVTSVGTAPITRPGKSAQAVGQIAKVAVAEAKAAGIDLPKNAQGMAASAIAKGADPSTIFAALIAPEPEVDVVIPDDDVVAVEEDVIVAEESGDPVSDPAQDLLAQVAEDGYAVSTEALRPDVAQTDAEIALALLNETA